MSHGTGKPVPFQLGQSPSLSHGVPPFQPTLRVGLSVNEGQIYRCDICDEDLLSSPFEIINKNPIYTCKFCNRKMHKLCAINTQKTKDPRLNNMSDDDLLNIQIHKPINYIDGWYCFDDMCRWYANKSTKK
jgi:hypothetical protein